MVSHRPTHGSPDRRAVPLGEPPVGRARQRPDRLVRPDDRRAGRVEWTARLPRDRRRRLAYYGVARRPEARAPRPRLNPVLVLAHATALALAPPTARAPG